MNKKRIGTWEVSDLGLGCMGMTGFYGGMAIEQGLSFFDTADNYGFGENEVLLGSAIAPYRDKVAIATKVGVVRSREAPNVVSINGTAQYVKQQCDVSLQRIGLATIALYYLHHLDPNWH